MFDTLVIFLKDIFLGETLILKKNQQTTKHYKHDKLLIRQSVDNLYRKASHFVSFNDREVLKINVDVFQ